MWSPRACRPAMVTMLVFVVVLVVNDHLAPFVSHVGDRLGEVRHGAGGTTNHSSTAVKNIMENVESHEPRRHFVYYAIGKTGSLQTRRFLKARCYTHNLTCVTFGQMCGLGEDISACISTTRTAIGRDEAVGTGDLTVLRLTHCCPKFVQLNNAHAIDALVDHFPLNVPENREFVKNGLPADALHFVTVRDPVDHFISYHHMLTASGMMKVASLRSLSGCIDKFYTYVTSTHKTALTAEEAGWFAQLANYQSHYLGYVDDEENVNATLDLLDGIHVVGLTHRLDESMRRFARALRWPETAFEQATIRELKSKFGASFAKTLGIMDKEVEEDVHNGSNHGGRTKKTLSPEDQRKLRKINHMDQMVFERATEAFHSQTSLYS